jgi:hypothetical protein
MMMKNVRQVLVVACAALISACASAPAGDGAQGRGDPMLITAAEIQASPATNVHQLITSLRPGWLQTRGGSVARSEDGGNVIIYLNQARLGGPGELQQMTLEGITSIAFVDARTATQRWGTGHAQGAIVVSTTSLRR